MLDIFLYAGRAIMPLLLMMALGCGLRRVGRWSDDFYRQLNGFCFHVLLPVQLFLNVYAIEDLSVLNWRLLGFIVVCILGAAGLGVAAAVLFVLYYPALSGLPIPAWWADALEVLPSFGFY